MLGSLVLAGTRVLGESSHTQSDKHECHRFVSDSVLALSEFRQKKPIILHRLLQQSGYQLST